MTEPLTKEQLAEIAPCPFCGCLAALHCDPWCFREGAGYRIECEGTCHSMTCWWHTESQALEAWNKRTSHALIEQERDLLAAKYTGLEKAIDNLTVSLRRSSEERKQLEEHAKKLGKRIVELQTDCDRLAAKLATAKVCDKCEKGKVHKRLECYPALEDQCAREDHYEDCPHCVNGVQFSDERARELLERLARAEEACQRLRAGVGWSPEHLKACVDKAVKERAEEDRDARAKEGAAE